MQLRQLAERRLRMRLTQKRRFPQFFGKRVQYPAFFQPAQGGKLLLGEDNVMNVPGVADGKVTVGVRPEGFVPDEKGGLCCKLLNVEVMGRDVSVVSTHPAFQGAAIRAIVASDAAVSREAETVRFRLKPNKVLLFDPETELRIPFEV